MGNQDALLKKLFKLFADLYVYKSLVNRGSIAHRRDEDLLVMIMILNMSIGLQTERLDRWAF